MCRSKLPQANLLNDLDQLMIEKWEQSDKILWSLNQIFYAGAMWLTKPKKDTSEVSLKEWMELKQTNQDCAGYAEC